MIPAYHGRMASAGASLHFSPRPNRAAEIHWRPWGRGAFAEAAAAGRPVLLAISAVWCHWCHVMDETSYSDGEVIHLLNERFVPIRVDNDERPDVNRRYNMGGWPTTAFLTPSGEIIHGATYMPPDQMRQTLAGVADLWRDRSDELLGRVAELRAKEAAARTSQPDTLSWEIVESVERLVRGQYDAEFGGFGRAPKFPQPQLLRFLVERLARGADEAIATMVRVTLRAMAGGGMYDHVEGGFFRYSTTRDWKVPHFEKMLEDNSRLLGICADAHRIFPGDGFDRLARDVVRWMDAVLWRGDAGAFGGSQDADERYFALDLAGREVHGAPYVDRTVYTSWNALAASGYLAAARALGEEALAARAVVVLRSLLARMRAPDGTLYHCDRGEGPLVPDLLGDHAALLGALLDAHELDRMPEALDAAVAVATQLRRVLEDQASGGFFDAPARDEPGRLAIREKPIEDGAEAAHALLRLGALTGEQTWSESAARALGGFVGEYARWGQFAAGYGTAVALALAEPLTVTVVGPHGHADASALWRVAAEAPARAATQWLDTERDGTRIARLGYLRERVAAYVCIGRTCSAPLQRADELRAELARAAAAVRR